MARVRFAPSPTGFLHVGSARTFLFNWLFARHLGGTMILRVDDTDLERNTEASERSIFEGLSWLGLNWDEEYRQSERLALHRAMAEKLLANGVAYRDFSSTPSEAPRMGAVDTSHLNAMREMPREESERRAKAGEPFAVRYKVPRDREVEIKFKDAVYGEQAKSTADIEDFVVLRSDGMPTYHLASCADDADLRITHIIRGQDHLSNTFKHVLIFEGAGLKPPDFAHLPLLVAPDGTKLSKRKHGPVVSVTTYRDAGFLPEAFLNFLALLGWSPKDDRQFMRLEEMQAAFSLEGINKSNAVVNFTEEQPFDDKAVWLNAEHIRALPVAELAQRLLPALLGAGYPVTLSKVEQVAPLIRERIKLLNDAVQAADFFFKDELAPYDPNELIPEKGADREMTLRALERAREVLAGTEFTHQALDAALRGAAKELGLKAGPMFQPVRVAVCGRKNAPPLFETLEVVGKERTLERIGKAIEKLLVPST